MNRLQGAVEQLFPKWAHERARHKWERQWADPNYSPFWKTEQPQREFVEAIESGWFNKSQRVVDVGCGNGEVSRWLSAQGFAVTGVDYSAAAVDNCRRLAAGARDDLKFDVADLCSTELRLPSAGSLVDRGCFHRIPDNFRNVYAQNVARAAEPGGHFLLLCGTFQDARFANYRGARSEPELRAHIQTIFGDYFTIDRAESAVINASQDQEAMPALAVWMTRKADRPVTS